MKKIFRLRNILILLVLIFALMILRGMISNRGAMPIEYFAVEVEKGPLSNEVNATGTVETVVTVQVGSQVSGQVEELYADFNSVVKRGQLLAKLDTRNSQAQLENAQANVEAVRARIRSSEADQKIQAANLQSAKANLEAARVNRDNLVAQFRRSEDLSKNRLISTNDYENARANADSAKAQFEQSKAALAQVEAQLNSSRAQLDQVQAQLQQAVADMDRAKLNLEYCNIYSPVDGVVISRDIDVGQTIAASYQAPTLFTIANDLTHMQVNASVDEADIGNISEEADVRFTVDAYPNDTFKGQIAEIRLNPETVQNVVTYSVILSIENSELKLKPGMTANITITVDRRDNVIQVPNSALRYTPEGMQREESVKQIPVASASETERTAARPHQEAAHIELAPGQKWNPSDKIRFVAPKETGLRSATVFILNSQRRPEARQVVTGITDGIATEVVSGDIKVGDMVITSDSTQVEEESGQRSRGFGPFGRF
jgi:HlyD family secretion protein